VPGKKRYYSQENPKWQPEQNGRGQPLHMKKYNCVIVTSVKAFGF
jgi:hypothetical protein